MARSLAASGGPGSSGRQGRPAASMLYAGVVLYLLFQLMGAVRTLQCFECVYTNVTLRPGAMIQGKVPTQACLDLSPSVSDANVHINESCSLGCKSTHYVQGGMQLVLRGCLQPSRQPCANYTTPEMSETCCTSPRCNHGRIGQTEAPRQAAVKCYQCVGSNSDKDKTGMNKYADKTMHISKDCMDETFNPSGKYVELNQTCETGCLTGTITDKQGTVYVNRGCASTKEFQCISGMMSGEQTSKPINRNMRSIVQKCCTKDYCNVGDGYIIVKPEPAKPTTFPRTTTIKHANEGKKVPVVGSAGRTKAFSWLLIMGAFTLYIL